MKSFQKTAQTEERVLSSQTVDNIAQDFRAELAFKNGMTEGQPVMILPEGLGNRALRALVAQASLVSFNDMKAILCDEINQCMDSVQVINVLTEHIQFQQVVDTLSGQEPTAVAKRDIWT